MSYPDTFTRVMKDVTARAMAAKAVHVAAEEARVLNERVMRDADEILGAKK